VEILFATRQLEKLCNSMRNMVKELGEQRAKILQRRLDQLRAAENLEAMRFLPGRCHELTGDLKGCLSLDLDGPYRLLFEPMEEPAPLKADGGLDWCRVIAIRILEVEDTHA
jgi:plasmid maintenance system killer protein